MGDWLVYFGRSVQFENVRYLAGYGKNEMKTYRLTINFMSEGVTTWDFPRYDGDDGCLAEALSELKGANVKSFSLLRLDDKGKPVKQPKVFDLMEMSVEDQREILKA